MYLKFGCCLNKGSTLNILEMGHNFLHDAKWKALWYGLNDPLTDAFVFERVGSGVVLDCIVSRSLPSFLLCILK